MTEAKRSRGDGEILKALNTLSEELAGRLDEVRIKQEKLFAVAVSLQEHKTIEKTDLTWETLAQWRSVYASAVAVGARAARFTAWGCGTLLALAALVIAAEAAGLIKIHW